MIQQDRGLECIFRFLLGVPEEKHEIETGAPQTFHIYRQVPYYWDDYTFDPQL